MSSPRSPKRRKILSSINPPEHDADHDDKPSHRGRQRTASEHDDLPRQAPEPSDTHAGGSGAESAPRVTKFRFKSKSHRRHRSQDSSSSRRHHRRPRSPSPSGSTSPRKHHHHQAQDPFSAPLDPDVAFRESLFDAMADDEGAAYWQTVYGQPIHVYPPTRTNPQGELERMTDDEYAAHVRQKMWERTHAGLIEERAARERQREEEERAREEGRRIAEEMERSLRRGEERRRNKMWKGKWDEYVRTWSEWEGGGAAGVEGIPWPAGWKGTQGGEGERDAKAEEKTVRAFFVRGLGLEEVGEREFAARLKDERVRWHPDKMQQRLGGTVDTAVMRDVTAIFQVIDGLWNDTRKGSG
ncbi:hypothetical protein B0H67DRAFT_491504 [Lasiosphaeris hirsuta]|uniref:Uncharacterized protein n=1 Tax=Lasiosphaeris hirsuta TaxID=260670 RepID=A0AA40A8E6_9PEZI|nr:hypothetical protein B0H67DRAFT_491504 [Lasiosphaeris hirsuta]